MLQREWRLFDWQSVVLSIIFFEATNLVEVFCSNKYQKPLLNPGIAAIPSNYLKASFLLYIKRRIERAVMTLMQINATWHLKILIELPKLKIFV